MCVWGMCVGVGVGEGGGGGCSTHSYMFNIFTAYSLKSWGRALALPAPYHSTSYVYAH